MLTEVTGEWTVQFKTPFDEEKTVETSVLTAWDKHQDEWVRHFSGTATYTTTVHVPAFDGRLILDLGNVKNIAEVYVNGKEVATLWKSPFRVDITDFVDCDTFSLDVKVTNLWVNRLIGEAALKPEDRKIYVSAPFYKQSDKLLPSGMTGPVKLIMSKSSFE